MAVVLCVWCRAASGQADTTAVVVQAAPGSVEWFSYLPASGDDESYLRYLQLSGAVPVYPWSLRGFSERESRQLAARAGTHPWSGTRAVTSSERRTRLLPLSAELRANSAFPYGSNDGAVWAGRGLTAVLTAGFTLKAGLVSLVLAPTAFITQNAAFDILDNGQSGNLRFADARFPTSVDRPQRFGDNPYGSLDPGNSTLRADVGFLAAGVSTANVAWGPLELYPFVLGTNAPGFLHGFAGTSRPVNLWIGSLHGRMIWGRLDQSEYSAVEGEASYVSTIEVGTKRFGSGLLVVFEPRGVRGLELGIGRFFHSPWPRSGIPRAYFTKPFESILKYGLTGSPEFHDPATSVENQIISGFARWVFPAAGFEMYAEYGREDHSWDKRDFVQEPDHSRSYGLGFRKTLRLRRDAMDGLTFELINFQLPHLARSGRGEGSIYTHSYLRQGHTHRGQLLGAHVGVGAAAGSIVRWDRYRPRGHTAISLERTVRQEIGNLFADGGYNPKASDVQYALSVRQLRRMRGLELITGAALVHNFNRNFERDVTNLSVVVGTRIPLGR